MGGASRNSEDTVVQALAVLASLAVILAMPGITGAVTLSGGTSRIDDASSPPDVVVSDAIVDDSSSSTVEVAYNVTGVVASNDTVVRLQGPAGLSVSNGSLSASAGVATLTIPADVYGGGNLSVTATVANASTGTPLATDSATLAVVSNATVSGFGLSSTDVTPGENVTVSAFAENFGSTAADVTVALYEDGIPVDSTRVTVPGNGSEEVSFDRSYPSEGTHTLAVNTFPEETVNVTSTSGFVGVTGYVVPKRTVNVTEPFWVNATVENTKSTAENATVDLYENGTVVDTRVVPVDAGANATVPFLAAFGTADNHTVSVNGVPPTNVTVLAGENGTGPDLAVIDHTVSKDPVNVSESFWVNATVTNSGDAEGSMRVDLYGDGSIVDSRNVTVGPSNTTIVPFETAFGTSGEHTVSVTYLAPTTVNVTGGNETGPELAVVDQHVSNTTVAVDEPLWVNATVTNTGDAVGSMRVDLYGDGTVVDSQNVTLGPGENATVSFDTAFGSAGEHSVNVTGFGPVFVNVTSGPDDDGGSSNLSVVDYTVSNTTVAVGESFWVNATVANTGDRNGSMWVDLYHDGGLWDSMEVFVGANATEQASFRTNFSTSGNHTVNVTDGVPTTVEVLGGSDDDGGSNLTVSYTVSETTVNVSESFWVNATVHNHDLNDTSETVTLYADGSPVETRTVNVSAGTNETVPFAFSFADAGTHSVVVNGLSPTTVEVAASDGGGGGDGGTASIAVIDMDVSKWHVNTNETVTVNATVENTGNASGTKTVEFSVAGLAEQSRTVTLGAGNSTTVTFTRSFDTAGNWGVKVTGVAEQIVQVTDGGPSGSHVVAGDLTHVGGTEPDTSQVVLSAEHSFGLYQVQLQNGTADGSDLNQTYDLDGLGVDKSTEFRIDLTLNGSVPRLLLGNGKNVSWTRQRNADGTWNVTIYARGSHVESIFDQSTSPWPTGENDTADTYHNVSVSLAIDSLTVLDESKRHTMNGTVFATDAQEFSSPAYTPPAPGQPPELSLYVAGPHYGVNGSTNTGYFDAFVPDAMLAEWNVSEPSELAGSYQGSQSATTARWVPGGMRVELDIHYSDGDVSIVKTGSLQTGYLNGTVTNGSGGSIVGATVTVRNATTGQTAASVTTDASGNYSVSLTNGTYDVVASASGYEDATHSDVAVTAGSATDADFTLSSSTTLGTIEGTILNGSDDTPIVGASVAVSNASGTVATTTTDSNGVFTTTVSGGSYNVSVSADGYVTTTLPGVPVTSGQTTRFTGRLTPASSGSTGFVNGTVTNASGPVTGATVTAYGPTSVQTTTTDASGNYSVAVEEGFVGLEYSAPGHGVHSEFVEATAGNTTRVDVTLREPGTITGTVVDENGDPISGATVDVWGPSAGQTTTDAGGNYSLTVGAGEYAVEIRAKGYPPRIVRGVSVNVSETETVDATLRQPGFVTGTVVDAQGNPLSNVWVGAEDGATLAYATTNASGHFNVSAVPGNYSVTGFGPNGEMVSVDGTVRVTGGNATDVGTLTSVNPSIVDSDVRHVGGTRPDMQNVSLEAETMGGMLMVQLTNTSTRRPGMPVDISDLGVDDTTRFEITLTVEDYDPNALLWGARNVSWSATANATDPNATDITVRTNTVHLAGIDDRSLPVGPITRQSPDDIRWPTGAEDRADLGWNNTVYFMLYDLGSMPTEVSQSLDNMTVVTNAQTFSRPQMVNGTLRVYAAGPHYTKQGATHDGFYSAFVPDAQLAEWNVTDPSSQLEVSWQGDDESFTVEETTDGAWIHLDIHYSDGYAEVAPGDTTAPTADAGSDVTVEEDTAVNFDGSASSDDTGIESYDWEFGDGATASGASPSHTFADDGTYTVTLTVTDAAGNEDTDTLTVTVEAASDGGGDGGGGGGGAPVGGGATADVQVTGRTLLNGTVDAGSDVVVRVGLANEEPIRGKVELTLAVDDSVVTTREWAVAASSERTVFLESRLDTPGEYVVSVDGVEVGSVAVSGSAPTPDPEPGATPAPDATSTPEGSADGPPPTAKPTPTGEEADGTTTPADPTTPAGTSSGSGAGFGPVLALGALLAAGLLASRRRR
jgi:PGF-CTERM protein